MMQKSDGINIPSNVQIPVDHPKGLLEEAEKLKPSNEPSYWAKQSCRHCYGRGIVGNVTYKMKGDNKVTQQLVCSCTKKRYNAWLNRTIESLRQTKIVESLENPS